MLIKIIFGNILERFPEIRNYKFILEEIDILGVLFVILKKMIVKKNENFLAFFLLYYYIETFEYSIIKWNKYKYVKKCLQMEFQIGYLKKN